MKRFHIRITINETGEVWYENNVSAFVGGANEGERSVAMAGTDCALVEVAQAVNAAERAIKKLKKRNPQLKKLVRRERKAGKIKEDK